MRLHKIKNVDSLLDDFKIVIKNALQFKGKWQSVFNNNNEIHLEIGMGKGKFINSLATLNKDINYIGIEKSPTIVFKAVNNISQNISNLRVLLLDACFVDQVFTKDEIAKIYLNFSDPWPKKKHIKRRLTNISFLKKYQSFLKNKGIIEQKTDQLPFFEYSLEEYKKANYDIIETEYDFNSQENKSIMTEYEEKFKNEGKKIMYAKVMYENIKQ